MQLTLASKTQKAKMFLDGRDLDQSDTYGKQEVKSVTLARPNIFIVIDASFAPEEIMGVAYSAGTVSTHITLDPVTGKLKKVEKFRAGSWVRLWVMEPSLPKKPAFYPRCPISLNKF